ncbi:unnamed protein product [Gongylonema pulchrum]|uniref:FCH domain-containing protein n=1 Tax=Gongylonema pulchrum TaxID=637853 RepID=A0A183DE21_9BILA|nr:unnamed protein product [Gongylonema pulchrum]
MKEAKESQDMSLFRRALLTQCQITFEEKKYTNAINAKKKEVDMEKDVSYTRPAVRFSHTLHSKKHIVERFSVIVCVCLSVCASVSIFHFETYKS